MRICQHCNKKIPCRIKINGKTHNLQNRLFCLDCSPFKKHNTRPIVQKMYSVKDNVTYKICPVCKQLLELNTKNYYVNKSGKYHSWCRKCNNKKSIECQTRRKQSCVNYKGGKCIICGYSKYIGSLDFHHIDPTKKEFNISVLRTYSIEKLYNELDKCVCICKNCHSELHFGMIQLPPILDNQSKESGV